MKLILQYLAVLWVGLDVAALASPARDQGTEQGEGRFLSRVRQLIFEGRRSGEGYFSPDGRALIFQSEREPGNPFYQIYLLDLETGDSHRVSPGLGKTTCGFFRPGTDEISFASSHLDPEALAKQQAELEFRASGRQRRYSWDYDERMDIFSARRDGSGLKRLTDAPGYDAEAAYAPDGARIVFCSLRGAYPTNQLSPEDLKRFQADPAFFGELYLMNADGSDQRRLTAEPGYDGGPFFSPDGRRILWRRFEPDGLNADIYTMNTDASDVRRLTRFKSMSWAPYFHPSGQYAIFTSNKEGFSNFELYIVDAEGQREPVRVTYTESFDGLPVFAPDGRQLCWASARGPGGMSQLHLADWDHGAALAALREAPLVSPGPAPGAAPTSTNATAPRPDLAIRTEDLRALVGQLASEKLAGRMTGTEGSRQAAELIAARLREAGLGPAGDGGTYFQDFSFRAGVNLISNANEMVVTQHGATPQSLSFAVEKDFRPLAFSANGRVEGEVVFAGYGLRLPGGQGQAYNSYAGLDVSNKVVLILRYVPEGVEPARRQELNHYAGLRYKAILAREQGARGVLVVTGPNSPNAGELIPLVSDASLADSGIVALTISGRVAEALLAPSGKNLPSLQSALDKEDPHAEGGFALPGVRVTLAAALEQVRKSDRNVLARWPGPSGQGEEPRSWLVVGAHYDHLGFGEAGSLQSKAEEGQVHLGADDNASGTAVVLEMAAQLPAAGWAGPERRGSGVLFALWSGEEIGMIGSTHFVQNPPVPLSNVAAYVNFDMVGHLRENRLMLQGVGSSSRWRRIIEKRNVAAGFNLVLQEDPYLPTDVTAFYPKGVPVLNFFTGSHEHYHRPTDRPETLDYPGMERIARFAFGLVHDLADTPDRLDYVQVSQSGPSGESRDALRVYLGTIPDYAAEVAGVKLSGVRGGGPADQAGLQGGDVIVEFAGNKIANIYDYTYALDAAKPGQPVKVVVRRGSETLTFTIVPQTRK